jgi:hypothetical protein
MHISTSLTLGLVITAGLVSTDDLAAQGQQVSVGAKPAYDFKSELYNGRGVKSLADLSGAPTIIEFWGVR